LEDAGKKKFRGCPLSDHSFERERKSEVLHAQGASIRFDEGANQRIFTALSKKNSNEAGEGGDLHVIHTSNSQRPPLTSEKKTGRGKEN